jgi:hypothetical protein
MIFLGGKMNQISRSILERIFLIIRDYELGKTNLTYLIDSLDGSISALEEKLSSNFYANWTRPMLTLDTFLALDLEKSEKEKISLALNKLRQIIKEELELPDN